ncbi:MAG TPA: universal stress protein [Acidimicrobiia bacterium]|nr:universal stress protein [Acidimicrobiia bacterium]
MTATTFLLLFFFVWFVVGLATAAVMARRGHDLWTWVMLGLLMGPLVLALVIPAVHRESHLAPETRSLHHGGGGPGAVSVLIGTDGSPDAEIAAATVSRLFGPQLGRVTVATVVDFDAADLAGAKATVTTRASELLEDTAALLEPVDADRVVLTGRPSDALLAYAIEHDVDLIVVGQRGAGLTPAVVGSTADQLVRQRRVPVLLTGVPECVHS